MTDEEKARWEVKGWKEENNCVQAYLKGLAEGRKEVTYMTAEEYDKTLDKCKGCYLDMVDKFSKRNEDLEKTIEELQLNLRSRNDLVEELTMQIEGMKNAGNCNKAMECSKWGEQLMQGDKVTCCCGCVEWEKAE